MVDFVLFREGNTMILEFFFWQLIGAGGGV